MIHFDEHMFSMGWFNRQLGFFEVSKASDQSFRNAMMNFVCLFQLKSPFKTAWKAKCPISKAIVAGFRGKVAGFRTLGVPGVVVFGKGCISDRFGKMFSRSAGTFNTRYLMTRRYPKKYELSCVLQDSSISHYYYYLLNLMYSHFLTSGYCLVAPCYYICLTTKKIQPNPNPNTSHPGEPPQFFQVPGFPKSPLEPGEFGSEVFHSALCLLAGTFRGHLGGCGTSRRSPVTWWMDGWMVKVAGR